MKIISIRVINNEGGLFVTYEDGTTAYCDPNTERYDTAVASFDGDIQDYVPN